MSLGSAWARAALVALLLAGLFAASWAISNARGADTAAGNAATLPQPDPVPDRREANIAVPPQPVDLPSLRRTPTPAPVAVSTVPPAATAPPTAAPPAPAPVAPPSGGSPGGGDVIISG